MNRRQFITAAGALAVTGFSTEAVPEPVTLYGCTTQAQAERTVRWLELELNNPCQEIYEQQCLSSTGSYRVACYVKWWNPKTLTMDHELVMVPRT